MKFLLLILSILFSNTAFAGDCTMPYLNGCVQYYRAQELCVQSHFPDLTTPSLNLHELKEDQKKTIACQMQIIEKCTIMTLQLDNESCLKDNPKRDDPFTDSTPRALMPNHDRGGAK